MTELLQEMSVRYPVTSDEERKYMAASTRHGKIRLTVALRYDTARGIPDHARQIVAAIFSSFDKMVLEYAEDRTLVQSGELDFDTTIRPVRRGEPLECAITVSLKFIGDRPRLYHTFMRRATGILSRYIW